MENWDPAVIVLCGKDKVECQDAAWAEVRGQTLFLAVADGVGSQPNSALGARKSIEIFRSQIDCTDASVESVMELADRLFKNVADQWQSWAEASESEDLRLTARSLQTTFALCVERDGILAVRSVGDSLCFTGAGEGRLNPLLSPVRDESGGVATLLTSVDITEAWVAVNLDDPLMNRVVLSTDGLDRTLLRDRSAGPTGNDYFEKVDPYLTQILDQYVDGEMSVDSLGSELSTGLIEARGAKGDDIGIAMANR